MRRFDDQKEYDLILSNGNGACPWFHRVGSVVSSYYDTSSRIIACIIHAETITVDGCQHQRQD
jgi:hypothetical protein